MVDTKTAIEVVRKNLPYKMEPLCIEAWRTLKAIVLAQQTTNSAMDAIAAIEGAIRIVDTWLPKVADEEHRGECEALHKMYRAFLKVTQQQHQ